MKKVRAAAVIAVVTTAVSQARDYAREHPDQAAQTLDQVEGFLRGKPRRSTPRTSTRAARPCARASGCRRVRSG